VFLRWWPGHPFEEDRADAVQNLSVFLEDTAVAEHHRVLDGPEDLA
jgi:hypothetical protein